MGFSKMDYCQFLLSSPVNHTLTYLAQHAPQWSHDTINRYLREEELTPRLLWENVRQVMEAGAGGYLLFDDSVLDKAFGPHIEMRRRQWSGNEHAVIGGIGLVSCVYVNQDTGEFWVIDYRLYDPDNDGKTKLDHVSEMLESARTRLLPQGQPQGQPLPFHTVLMDSWYATKDLMLQIDGWKKQEAGAGAGAGAGQKFYCPLKSNRRVDDSQGQRPYRAVSELEWSEQELKQGKVVKIHGFPKDYKVRLFQVVLSPQRTEYVVTNDKTQDSTHETRKVCAVRWKIEEYHRELKQLTGIQNCQCRKRRIQRNHIACALLVWARLKHIAYHSARTIYQVKNSLLHDYMVQQLKTPTIKMVLA